MPLSRKLLLKRMVRLLTLKVNLRKSKNRRTLLLVKRIPRLPSLRRLLKRRTVRLLILKRLPLKKTAELLILRRFLLKRMEITSFLMV